MIRSILSITRTSWRSETTSSRCCSIRSMVWSLRSTSSPKAKKMGPLSMTLRSKRITWVLWTQANNSQSTLLIIPMTSWRWSRILLRMGRWPRMTCLTSVFRNFQMPPCLLNRLLCCLDVCSASQSSLKRSPTHFPWVRSNSKTY